MKFTQIARISRFAVVCAVLFCVCGAASATDYYFDPDRTFLGSPGGDFNTPANWKEFDGSGYSEATVIPMTSDSAFFGKSQDVPNGLQLKDTDYNIVIRTNNAAVSYLYVCFSNDSKSVGTVSFSNFPNGNFDIKMVTDNFIIYNDNENTKKTIFLNTMLTVNSDITIPSGIKVTVGRRYSTTINGNITIERGGSLEVNSTLNVNGEIINNGTIDIGTDGKIEGKITNNSDGTINIGGGTLASNGEWSNKGTVTVGKGTATFTASAKDEGTWRYTASRTTVIADIQYNVLWITADVTLDKSLVAVGILAEKDCTLDLKWYDVKATWINISGTIKLYGSQNITQINSDDSPFFSHNNIVEFYGPDIADVSKMGKSFFHLVCKTGGTTLYFSGTTIVNGTLTLNGENRDNMLTVTGNTGAIITVKNNAATGQWLKIDYDNVSVDGTYSPFGATQNCFDKDGNEQYGLLNGWKFRDTNVYYWFGPNATAGGDGNWSVPGNWRYGRIDGGVAVEYPGGKPNAAEVHIEPNSATPPTSAVVTLDVSLDGAVGNGNPIKNITLNNNATFNIGDKNLIVTGTTADAWKNEGTVKLSKTGDDQNANENQVSFANPATDDGTWIYAANSAERRGIVTNITYKNLIFEGANSITILKNAITNGTLTNDGIVNFANSATITTLTNNENRTINFTGATPTIKITNGTNDGTVTIDGNPNSTVNVTNSTNSTVNYTLTKADSANVNFGTTYGNLVCAPNSSNKTLNFVQDITVNGNLTLNGTSGNLLTITGNDTNITLARQQSGSYLKINHDHVSINSTGFSPYYNVGKTSTDDNGAIPIGNMHGWLFELQDDYYWFGPSGGNWNEPANWRFSNDASSPAPASPFYPGNAGSSPTTTGAKVHITPNTATTVALNITASVYSIEMNNNATLDIPSDRTLTTTNSFTNNGGTINLDGTLNANATWNNTGTVNVKSENATFSSRTVNENGTWNYTTARTDLVPITYNVLNLHGSAANTTIVPTSAVIANTVSINNDTTLALGANNLTVRGTAANSWTNKGIVTVTSGNATLPANAQDNGTWTYNNTTSRNLVNITYNILNLNGTNRNTITPAAAVSANTININANTTFALASFDVTATTINNNGTVRLIGNQRVSGQGGGEPTITNEDSSTVEYYGTDTGATIFGASYYDLICSTPGKRLNFNRDNTTIEHYLTLNGSAESLLEINTATGSAATPVKITVNTKQGESLTSVPPAGRYLFVNRDAVKMTGTTPLGTSASGADYFYYAEDSFDTKEENIDSVRNGWKLKMIELDPISIALSPVGSNTVYVRTNTANMQGLNSNMARRMLPRFFSIVVPNDPNPSSRQQALQINIASEARVVTSGNGTPIWIAFTLNNSVKLEDMSRSRYFIREKGKDDNIYYHALSDFAIDVVTPRYAFDNRHLDSGNAEEAAGGVAIRNWDRDQESNGQLVTKSDITISAGLNVDGLGVPVVYFDASPDAASVSTSYNSDAGGAWRIWLPKAFTGLAPVANSEYITFEEGASVGGNSLRFDLQVTKGEKFSSWKAGDQISFLFELKDANGKGMTVCHEPVLNSTVLNVSATAPLYALRLQVPEDITTLDLWSFKLRDIKSQRGNITIMNNVINVLSGENMILDVNVPVPGVLNIMVMTLDGTIVKYLQHGSVSQGKHVYHWDGRNNSGKPVARGLYFIRIVGCTIDESRKVMAVWQ